MASVSRFRRARPSAWSARAGAASPRRDEPSCHYTVQLVAVMYLGHIVEISDRTRLYEDPKHPYTMALLSAVPIPDPEIEAKRKRIILKGDLPSPSNPPPACVFP